jgi:hypothetical protein
MSAGGPVQTGQLAVCAGDQDAGVLKDKSIHRTALHRPGRSPVSMHRRRFLASSKSSVRRRNGRPD